MKNKKGLFVGLLCVVFLFSAISASIACENCKTTELKAPNKIVIFKIGDSYYYEQNIDTKVKNKVKMDTAPFIKNSRTYVPVRFLGNALGIDDNHIGWNGDTREVILEGAAKIRLKIGSKVMIVDNRRVVMDVAPIISNARTMLPARWVAENLGFKVDWDNANRLVIVYPKEKSRPTNDDISNITGKQLKIDLNFKNGVSEEEKIYVRDFYKNLYNSWNDPMYKFYWGEEGLKELHTFYRGMNPEAALKAHLDKTYGSGNYIMDKRLFCAIKDIRYDVPLFMFNWHIIVPSENIVYIYRIDNYIDQKTLETKFEFGISMYRTADELL
ncbi:copper amine oxidase N-terminal domain-containing protein [Thermosyntropha sp.]|uniref:copper amine oxidase N-terminal domain-containing protein n=1 Tax=Thermosyntropha sp. TaxID=2740820 RepID=UPI0025D114E3|nr:copper amine oxidase N-terminal domain-containing protein [Thermosyntropha sp.]MBO8158444.1 copper amine oxidase N-terminal domain-containing protein [Thermosyntropha sp.]